MTVQAFAMQSEIRVGPASAPSRSSRVEKQGVVRADGDDEQHPDQMQNRQSHLKQRQHRGDREHGEHERCEHAGRPAGRSQGDQEQHDDGDDTRPRTGAWPRASSPSRAHRILA